MNDKVQNILSRLLNYDIITFDIFDTLITRQVICPTDVFLYVEKISILKNGFGNNFHKYRQEAEQLSYKKYGERVTLETIYLMLQENYNYTKIQCDILMNLELEAEKELIIPRIDMLYILNELQKNNKKIVLISDMYLSSAYISILLKKCGFYGDFEIWVSNEIGASKSTGKLWKNFFEKIKDKKTIHLGDNKWSDIHQVKVLGHEAILIKNSYEAYIESALYQYLSKYENGEISNSLLLGTLINEVYFNSPFGNKIENNVAIGLWLGPVFACFMNWLVDNIDASILLFVTREGYIFLPMYEAYCDILEIEPQKHIMFYASRSATTSASILSEKDIQETLQIRYEGTLGNFTKSRLDFILPEKDNISDVKIELPRQQKYVMSLLTKYSQKIISNTEKQHLAYNKYLKNIREKIGNFPLTVVDIGYTGTAQYNLSKIFNEKINGKYIFLDVNVLPEKLGCSCKSLAKTTDKIHPIYENLLFLEAAIQVPYGQLKRMTLYENGDIKPVFNNDKQTSKEIKLAQKAFLDFVKKEAKWKKQLGSGFKYDFNLAEDIWMVMIQYNILPDMLLKCFWLSDDFSGNANWKYDIKEHKWISKNEKVPVVFSLEKNRFAMKYKLKNTVKKYVPRKLYEPFKYIWIKFIK